LATNLYALLRKENDVLGDEGIIEGVEVESGRDWLLAVGKRDGHNWERRRRRDDGEGNTGIRLDEHNSAKTISRTTTTTRDEKPE
jgi:hypothetical protein